MDFEKIIGRIATALQISDVPAFIGTLKTGDELLEETELGNKLAEAASKQLKAAKTAQYTRGNREAWAFVEKFVKLHGFEGGEDLKESALLDAFSEHIKGVDAKATMTREELEALPAVKALISERLTKHAKSASDQVEKVKADFDAYRKQTETERVKTLGRSYIVRQLEESEVLLEPKGTGVKKEARIDAILRAIDWGKVGLNKDGIPVMLSDDGQPDVDDFGAQKEAAIFAVKTGLEIYGQRGPDSDKGGGEPKPGNGQPGKYVPVHSFSTEAEFTKAYTTAETAQARAQMSQDWQFQQQKKAAG